ncbi:MAG: EAL domain-containing protein [Syntrophorhabdaceae bacterium]|nr:EAL domain-containing protein [Syntrophorhabdaceae bacterium]
MSQIFIGRQPILGKREEIFGYELLFRTSPTKGAEVIDDTQATASVLINTLNEIGLNNLIGNKKGFINVNKEVLSEGFIELLPKSNIVLEILERVEIDDELIKLVGDLKKKGVSFALDDVICEGSIDRFLSILDMIDYVKIDILGSDRNKIHETVKNLKMHKVKLLAEKIETKEVFTFCLELGFEFFQGYFFAKPAVIEKKATSPSQFVLIELFNNLSKGKDVSTIERIFKKSPELDVKLLKFINSASFYLAQKISSISQAIITLGYRNLQKWTSLMLFAKTGVAMKSNPLFERAAIRGFFMELLSYRITKNKDLGDAAFITGILSLVDTLMGAPLKEIIKDMNLSEEIQDALLDKKGVLGELLQIVCALEENDFDIVKNIMERYNIISEDLYASETEAILNFERMDLQD